MLGKRGIDLIATTEEKTLGLQGIQVWKGGGGVLTDSRLQHIPHSTFDGDAKLGYLGVSMLQSLPMCKDDSLPVKIKKSHNFIMFGAVNIRSRDMSWEDLIGIILMHNIMMTIVTSTGMLCQYGFFAKAIFTFGSFGICEGVVAINMVPSREQVALLTFCICISVASVGVSGWKKASRKEKIKVKIMVGEEGNLDNIVVQRDDVKVEELRKELQLSISWASDPSKLYN